MEIDERLFKIAYKKLKSSIYYDKTETILRNDLVKFERDQGEGLDSTLADLRKQLIGTEADFK